MGFCTGESNCNRNCEERWDGNGRGRLAGVESDALTKLAEFPAN
jgi:hypothetical protein